jgi:hypothetical protein
MLLEVVLCAVFVLLRHREWTLGEKLEYVRV